MFKNRAVPSQAQEAAEDVFFGQIAIIWARWFLIAAGMLVALSSTSNDTQFYLGIASITILMTINFFAHGRYMMGKPINKLMLLTSSLVDLTVITTLVIFWGDGRSGINSNFFVLYYPLLFSWALVFSPRVTIGFSVIAISLYITACLIVALPNPPSLVSPQGFNTLASHIITLGAMSGLGTYYYRRQRDSLRALIASKPAPAFK